MPSTTPTVYQKTCPKCHGCKRIASDFQPYSAIATLYEYCRRCNGKGTVLAASRRRT